jgi:hypothetical protein
MSDASEIDGERGRTSSKEAEYTHDKAEVIDDSINEDIDNEKDNIPKLKVQEQSNIPATVFQEGANVRVKNERERTWKETRSQMCRERNLPRQPQHRDERVGVYYEASLTLVIARTSHGLPKS